MQTTTTDPQADTDVVAEVYAAFARRDLARIAALFAADGVITQSPALPWGGTHTGPEGLATFLGTLTAHLDSTPVTERLFADGAGRVVQVGRTRGTVRATGAAFDVPEVHLWTVADGRVRRFEAYVDTPAMLAALERPAS
ncbi:MULTISPECIES: nuclear transport factor 2 family protein [unclassified Geodermatophilus]